MILKNGAPLHRRVESYGSEGYVFWVEDSYFPTIYFVRGDNFGDAYEWFLCHPRVERDLEVTDPKDYDYPDWQTMEKATAIGEVSHLEYNDNGKLLDIESINGMELASYRRLQVWS